jgi:hypothetical protein
MEAHRIARVKIEKLDTEEKVSPATKQAQEPKQE